MSTAPRPAVPASAFIGFAIAVAGLAVALIAAMSALKASRTNAMGYIATVDSLHREVAALKEQNAAPTSEGTHDAAALPKLRDSLRPDELADLKALGLSDPVREIKADLMRHPELIPVAGTLGGRMGFYSADEIRILDSQWVYAEFDDGHRAGYALLAYEVKGGRIRWTRLASHMD